MKKSFFLISFLVLLVFLMGCSNIDINDLSSSPFYLQSNQDSINVFDPDVLYSDDPIMIKRDRWPDYYIYESMSDCMLDRVGKWIEMYLGEDKYVKINWEYDIVLVTLLDVDLNGCNPLAFELIRHDVRLDEVLYSSSCFDLHIGDTISGYDKARYLMSSDSYRVRYYCFNIPMTIVGSQYIVCVKKISDDQKQYYPDGCDFVFDCLTIPIADDLGLSNEEIYSIMNLSSDVIGCSNDFISRFLNKKNE